MAKVLLNGFEVRQYVACFWTPRALRAGEDDVGCPSEDPLPSCQTGGRAAEPLLTMVRRSLLTQLI
jgi:hypothetical protein